MSDDDPVLDAQRFMWSAGDYSEVAKRLLPISVDLVETIGVTAGDTLLDVGAGDGNTAIEAARRGAAVTGIDLTPSQVEKARARAASSDLDIDLRVGDAQRLDFPDGSFDAVVSVMGAIFAPDHRAAAAEMARVCRPGGTVALTSWAAGGWSAAWRARAQALVPVPPAGGPDPDAWGDADEVRDRLAAVGLEVDVHTREFDWSFPSPEEAVDWFLTHTPPFVAFQQAADAAGHGHLVRGEILAALDEANQAVDGSLRAPAPYLLAVATKPS
jgi:SAM-dependent methyltransferase